MIGLHASHAKLLDPDSFPTRGDAAYFRGLARVRNVNVTLAELIFEAQPYQRQIIMMREPVSRYYSAFHYYRQVTGDDDVVRAGEGKTISWRV